MAAKRVAIIGGGIAGLATALALKDSGIEVVILERDPAPPDITPDRAFDEWQRPGVPQFRHAHIMLARLQTIVRDNHPELLRELLDAGLTLSTVEEVLPSTKYSGVEPEPGDRDLLHLWGRRPTFEYVIRRYVGRLPNVQFIHGAKVVSLLTATDAKAVRARGVEYTIGDERHSLTADIVVDASGKNTKLPELLRAQGVDIGIDEKPSRFVYSCRHYRLKDPAAEPPRQDGGGSYDYLGYATFYAEHGNFSLTLGVPTDDTELAELIKRPETFEAMCEELPVLRDWKNISEAKTKVLGASRFENRWMFYRSKKGRELLDYFAIGDSHLETNPMYGRGCASAFVQAHVFADVITTIDDPAARADAYYERAFELLDPYFKFSVATDRIYHIRANLRRGLPVSLPDRFLNYAYETAWLPASYQSPVIAREFLKSVQMREPSTDLKTRFVVWFHIMRAGFLSLFRRPAQFEPPPRAEILRRLTARAE